MGELVSVVIPVYRTKEYLGGCIASVRAQDYPEIEMILVDDGSPDECGRLCDEYAAGDERIRAIHQENQGLGIARNSGMAAARGTYLFFLDSDDELDGAGSIRTLVEAAERERADITVGSFRRFDERGRSGINAHHLEGLDPRSARFRFRGFYRYGHLAYSWGKLYRRDFLERNDLRQRAYPFTQDKAHNIACYAIKPRYALVPESVYLYRVNTSSVTFRYKENLAAVYDRIAADFLDFLKERGIGEDYSDLVALQYFFACFYLVKQELQATPSGRVRASVRALREFGGYENARKYLRMLALGEPGKPGILRGVDSLAWKGMIRGGSILFALRLYYPLVWAIALLRGMEVDRRVTERRYTGD